MLRNTVAATLHYFYPFGNTPAVCLTQSLPPEQDADLLLLGCGDIRNILFTNYAGLGSRKLDFTCCDIEPAVIARNILLFSLIIDGTANDKTTLMWNIYYHVRVDSSSIELLQSQVAKLLDCSGSTSMWNDSLYGKVLRLCDGNTLAQVRSIWRKYSSKEQTNEGVLRKQLQKATTVREHYLGKQGMTMTGIRSAAPTGVLAVKDLTALAQDYWSSGCLYTGNALSAAVYLNPAVLLSGNRDPTLHYGSDPLLGFHLATAYIPLENSDLSPPPITDTKKRVVEAAQAEFRSWVKTFAKSVNDAKVLVRYFVGDALAFAHALQTLAVSQPAALGGYVDSWTFAPLVLDGGDYNVPYAPAPAPVSFNVIDTSNLGDHLGTLNLLIVTKPLLRSEVSSTVYTEILVQHESDVKSTLDTILCGEFESVGMLLGLSIVERWTNATPSSDVLDRLWSGIGSGKQSRTQLPWKPTDPTCPDVHVEPDNLAKLLHLVYKSMFGHESPGCLIASISLSGAAKVSNPYYNRASFVAFLRAIRGPVSTDWIAVNSRLLTLIENDDALSVSRNYLQEFNAYLHMTGLHTVDVLSTNPTQVFGKKPHGRLSKWSTLPALVAVTVEVPRNKLRFLTDMSIARAGIPIFCGSLQSAPDSPSQWLNQFGVIQSGFGHVKTEEVDATSGETRVIIDEDHSGWTGTSPLILSFYAPTWILLQDGDSTKVAVGLQPTVHTIRTFLKQLGPNLHIHEGQMRDANVHLSRFMPSQSMNPMTLSPIMRKAAPRFISPFVEQTTLSANIGAQNLAIDSFTSRYDLRGTAKEQLADKSTTVRVDQVSATELKLVVDGTITWTCRFPRPVSAARSKLRIARKSSYIEVSAPLVSPLQQDSDATFVYPMAMSPSDNKTSLPPIGLSTHTANLDRYPIINSGDPAKLDWLTVHASMMFSGRERQQRDSDPSLISIRDQRVDFKDGLFSMFMHSTGVQGQRGRIFGLHKEKTGVDTIIFVSSVRLDLNDRVVVLDAAVIPLRHSMMKDSLVRSVLGKLNATSPPQIIIVKVDDLELQIWKSALPAFAERCRTWTHKQKTCEYLRHGEIPTPNGLGDGSTPLCSCGLGQLPKNFMESTASRIPDLVRFLSKYATRIAISPVFYVPHVEAGPDLSGFENMVRNNATTTLSTSSTDEGCAACGKTKATVSPTTTTATGLLTCARCRAVKYCSRECQKKDWKTHKLVCA